MNKEKMQKVIKKMLTESEKINSVRREDPEYGEGMEEYYFTYPVNKYLWSLLQDSSGENSIFYYPSANDKSTFIRFGYDELAPSSKEDLKKLFETLRSKVFGFDDVLNDILSEESPE